MVCYVNNTIFTFMVSVLKVSDDDKHSSIDLFTVVCLVAWPLNESEAGVDLVLIDTSLLLLC